MSTGALANFLRSLARDNFRPRFLIMESNKQIIKEYLHECPMNRSSYLQKNGRGPTKIRLSRLLDDWDAWDEPRFRISGLIWVMKEIGFTDRETLFLCRRLSATSTRSMASCRQNLLKNHKDIARDAEVHMLTEEERGDVRMREVWL